MKLCIVLLIGCSVAPAITYATNFYADNNRELFLLPRSSAVGTSDYVFSRDGTNQSNPANLALDSSSEISLAYAGFYSNIISASILSYATSVTKNSGIGFSAGYLYNPDIPITDNLETMTENSRVVPVYDPSRISYLTGSEIYIHFGYGYRRSLFSGVEAAAGVAFNAMRHSLPPYRGYSIGGDAGATIDFVKSGLRMAIGCENITTNYTQWSKDWGVSAPPHVRIGVGWRKEIPYLYGRIQLQHKTLDMLANEGINAIRDSAENVSSTDQSNPTTKHFSQDPLYFLYSGTYGVEYTILRALSLRLGIPVGGGYNGDWSFGCGVNLMRKMFSVDISYLTHELAGTYQLSLTYRWCNAITSD